MVPTGPTEERNTRRKHSEIGETQLSDDTEYIKREMRNAARRSEEKVESLLQKFKMNTMENMQKIASQTNETILQSVGLELQGMNMTIGKLKEDNDDKYDMMNEEITSLKKDDHAGRPKQQRK